MDNVYFLDINYTALDNGKIFHVSSCQSVYGKHIVPSSISQFIDVGEDSMLLMEPIVIARNETSFKNWYHHKDKICNVEDNLQAFFEKKRFFSSNHTKETLLRLEQNTGIQFIPDDAVFIHLPTVLYFYHVLLDPEILRDIFLKTSFYTHIPKERWRVLDDVPIHMKVTTIGALLTSYLLEDFCIDKLVEISHKETHKPLF